MRHLLTPCLLAALLAGCAPTSVRPPVAAPSPSGPPPAAAGAPTAEPASARAASAPAPDPLAEVTLPPDPGQQALDAVWQAPEPRGTVPQVALRFLQALQRGEDLVAARDLTRHERFRLSFTDLPTLRLVLADVRKNAALGRAGACRRVEPLSSEAAVVHCGRQHVVVNVAARPTGRGVDISDWTAHYDVYRGPHSHAFTTIEL